MENIHVLRHPGMGEVRQNEAWASGSVQTGKCSWKHLTRSMQLTFGEAVVRHTEVISLLIQKKRLILGVTYLSSALPGMMV